VIAVPRALDPAARPDLLRRFGGLVASLRGGYETGPDVGTTAEDMDLVAETGSPWVHSRTGARGGAGGSGRLTALGVLAGMRAVSERLFGTASLEGRSVLVQGAGSVGGPLLDLLREERAVLFASETDPSLASRLRAAGDVRMVPPEEAFDAPVEIFAPCALGGILDAAAIRRLRARAVVGAANNQLASPGDALRLHERGILYAPDFVVNSGGAVGITGIESMGWTRAEAEARVLGIRGTLAAVFDRAEADGVDPDTAARRLALRRLEAGIVKGESGG
jgi:glutamate dehydrogenase/leucine dehydrogenase